jgi:hypothetical protein
MKRYPILLTFTDTIKLGMKQGLEDQIRAHREGEFTNLSKGQKLFKMWLKCNQNVMNSFQKKRLPQKAGNICIITRILYNFWGLNFVKIRHKRMAEISITTSRTLAYRHFKPVETPTYYHSKPRSQRQTKCTHTQIHQSSCQKHKSML